MLFLTLILNPVSCPVVLTEVNRSGWRSWMLSLNTAVSSTYRNINSQFILTTNILILHILSEYRVHSTTDCNSSLTKFVFIMFHIYMRVHMSMSITSQHTPLSVLKDDVLAVPTFHSSFYAPGKSRSLPLSLLIRVHLYTFLDHRISRILHSWPNHCFTYFDDFCEIYVRTQFVFLFHHFSIHV